MEILDMMGENDPSLRSRIDSNIKSNEGLEDWEKEKAAEYYLDKKFATPSKVDRQTTSMLKPKGFVESVFDSLKRRNQAAFGNEMGLLGMAKGVDQNSSVGRLARGEQGLGETAFQIAGQGAGAIGDVIGQAITPALRPVIKSVQQEPGLLGPIAEKIGEGLEPISQWFAQYKASNPRGAANISAAANLASMVPLSSGAKAAKPIVKEAAKSGLKTTGKIADDVIKNIPKSDRVADRLLQSALELNASQIQKISLPNIAGKSPFTWLREKGIIGTRKEVLPQLDELAKTARQAKLASLQGINGRFALKQSDQALDEVLKQIAPDGLPRAGLEDMAKNAALLRSLPERSLVQHETVKSLMDDVLNMYAKTGQGVDNIRSEGWRNLRDSLKTFIEKEASNAGFDDIKRLNKDIQVSVEIRKALLKTGASQPYAKLIPLLREMGGTGGAGALGFAIGGPLGAFAGVAIQKTLSNPKVQTVMARLLARYSDDEIAAVKALLQKGTQSKVAKRVMEEVAEDLDEVLKFSDSPVGSPQLGAPSKPVKSSIPSPDTLPENLDNVKLTPEERATGLIGGGGDDIARTATKAEQDAAKALSLSDDVDNIPLSQMDPQGVIDNNVTQAAIKRGVPVEEADKLAGGIPKAAKIPKELEPLAKEARKYKSAEEFVKSADTEKLYFDKVVEDIKTKLPNKEVRVTPNSVGVMKGNVRGNWIDNDDVWTFYPSKSIPEEFRVAVQKSIPDAKVMNGAIDFPKDKFPSLTKSQLTDLYHQVKGK